MKHLIILLLITNLSFSQEWSKIQLNDFLSVEFPNVHEKSEFNGDIYYSTSDDNGVYVVMIKNLNNQKMSESELLQFYQGFMNGALESADGELIEQNEFHLNGLKGYEMVYFVNSNPQLPNLRHKRILVANNNLISYEFWTYEEIKQLASTSKDKFFNSIIISEKKEIDPENKVTNSAYEQGYALGRIISSLFIIGLIVGVILLIRNITRKKKKNIE